MYDGLAMDVTIGRAADAPLVSCLMIGVVAILLGLARFAAVDGKSNRALLAMAAVCAIGAAFVIRTVYAEFPTVRITDTGAVAVFATPRAPVTIPNPELARLRVVLNRWRAGREMWYLELTSSTGTVYSSMPTNKPASVIMAAETLHKKSGRAIEWGLRTSGRLGSIAAAQEAEVRPPASTP